MQQRRLLHVQRYVTKSIGRDHSTAWCGGFQLTSCLPDQSSCAVSMELKRELLQLRLYLSICRLLWTSCCPECAFVCQHAKWKLNPKRERSSEERREREPAIFL